MQPADEVERPGPFRVMYFQAKAMRDERRDMLSHDPMMQHEFRKTLQDEVYWLNRIMEGLIDNIGRDIEHFYPKQAPKREHDATI